MATTAKIARESKTLKFKVRERHRCRQCGRGNFCDVCHKHDAPRGECKKCPPCLACAKAHAIHAPPPPVVRDELAEALQHLGGGIDRVVAERDALRYAAARAFDAWFSPQPPGGRPLKESMLALRDVLRAQSGAPASQGEGRDG